MIFLREKNIRIFGSILIGCCAIFISFQLNGQVPPDSIRMGKVTPPTVIPVDTFTIESKPQITQNNRDSIQPTPKIDFKAKKEKFLPVPRKALLYSIIPGGGQIYNRRWWKLPFVYGGLGTLGYFIGFNTREYRRYRDAIRDRANDLIKDEFTDASTCQELISTQQLRSFRDTKRKDMELTYIFFFITYGLTSVEAFVDAHLQSFDVSDDLSLRLSPIIDYDSNGPYPGLGLKFQLKKNKPAFKDFYSTSN